MYLNTDLVEITLFSYKLALIYEWKCKLLFCYYPYLIISNLSLLHTMSLLTNTVIDHGNELIYNSELLF